MARTMPIQIGVNQIAGADGIELIHRAELIEVRWREARPMAVLYEPGDVVEAAGAKAEFVRRRLTRIAFHQDERRGDPAIRPTDQFVNQGRRVVDDVRIDP